MKKKIGIVTMYYGNSNYGACLQAYALPYTLNKMGFVCEQISFTYRNDVQTQSADRVKTFLRNYGIKNTLLIILEELKKRMLAKTSSGKEAIDKIERRKNSVEKFREEYIPHSKNIFSNQTISQCKDYDAYICGSDQIWRIGWGYLNPGFWLTFVNDGGRKIAYAPSISMEEIPKSEFLMVKNALSDFYAISVREEKGKYLLEQIINKHVEQVLDPTLLLTSEEWKKITEDRIISDSYVFAYLLGDNLEDRKQCETFARLNGMKLVTIPYLLNAYRKCDDGFGDIQLSDISPRHFLSLIQNANFVITDSFHGTVFSLIFHRNFCCLKRSDDNSNQSMNSRIYSLLKLCKCENRVINHGEKIILDSIDYTLVDTYIEKERMQSIAFLKESLDQ